MRHRKSINHLGRKTAHREAMLANMSSSLIMHKRINTTLAKAKALRSYLEPLITRSKEDTTHNRRTVFSYLQNKEAVTELFRNISQKVADRPGGYTRILKTGTRPGDNADMCLIELVDYNEIYQKETKASAEKAKTRRSRAKKKAEDATGAPVKETAKEVSAPKAEVIEDVVEDIPVVEEVAEEIVAFEETLVEEVVEELPQAGVVEAEVVAEVEEPAADVLPSEPAAEISDAEPAAEESEEKV